MKWKTCNGNFKEVKVNSSDSKIEKKFKLFTLKMKNLWSESPSYASVIKEKL